MSVTKFGLRPNLAPELDPPRPIPVPNSAGGRIWSRMLEPPLSVTIELASHQFRRLMLHFGYEKHIFWPQGAYFGLRGPMGP